MYRCVYALSGFCLASLTLGILAVPAASPLSLTLTHSHSLSPSSPSLLLSFSPSLLHPFSFPSPLSSFSLTPEWGAAVDDRGFLFSLPSLPAGIASDPVRAQAGVRKTRAAIHERGRTFRVSPLPDRRAAAAILQPPFWLRSFGPSFWPVWPPGFRPPWQYSSRSSGRSFCGLPELPAPLPFWRPSCG